MSKTILAVDYDHKTLEEIQSFFEGQNVHFLMAHDGSQALEVYRSQKPDLVLTSALLPKLNGFELCRKITSGEMGEVRPVIMFSGIYKAEKYRREAIVGCGAVDFLEKPLIQGHLLKVIRNLFAGIPSAQTPPPIEVNIPTDPATSEPLIPRLPSPVPAVSTDLLEVDDIFDSAPSVSIGESTAASESFLLDPLGVETGPRLIPPESKDEIDVALDKYLIDVDKELQVRDQQIVQEIEREITLSGQNILDIDSELTAIGPSAISEQTIEEVIELEEPLRVGGEMLMEETHATAAIPATTAGKVIAQSSTPAPSFSLGQSSQRNWLPAAIIGLVILTVLVLFWVFGR